MSENQQNNSNQVAGALTFPSRNDVQPLPDQPRQPRNLQGLLRFAMEATRTEDAPAASDFTPMDDERRKFLEEALKNLTVNISDMIRASIKILSDQEKIRSIQLGDELPEDVQNAFDSLLEFVDDMDIANDFYKIGGFAIFPVCLGSENGTVRALACTVLGDVCQNNPFCQGRALECGLLRVILTLLEGERGMPLVKGIYALSCMCREFEPACREVVAADGCEVLAKLISAEEEPARTKVVFLLRYFCHNHVQAKEKFIELNVIKSIAAQIKTGRDSTTEHMFSVLLALLEDSNPTVIQQCTDPSIELQKLLEHHLNHPDLKDDTFSEEKEYCTELIKILKSCPQVESVNDEVDR